MAKPIERRTRDNPLKVKAEIREQAGHKILVATHLGETHALPYDPEKHEEGVDDLAVCRITGFIQLVL